MVVSSSILHVNSSVIYINIECNDLYFIAIAFIAFTLHEIKQCPVFLGTPGRSKSLKNVHPCQAEYKKPSYGKFYPI